MPTTSNDLPGSSPGEPGQRDGPPHPSLFGLSPSGVYRARRVTSPAGELLPHRFTLTEPSQARTSGLLSVALSLPLRAVGVTHHSALWSSDFPQDDRHPAATPSPSLAGRRVARKRELRHGRASGKGRGSKKAPALETREQSCSGALQTEMSSGRYKILLQNLHWMRESLFLTRVSSCMVISMKQP